MSNYERRDFEAQRISKLIAQEEFKEAELKAQESLRKLMELEGKDKEKIDETIATNDMIKKFGEKNYAKFLVIVEMCVKGLVQIENQPQEVGKIAVYVEEVINHFDGISIESMDMSKSVRSALKTLERQGKVKCLKASDGYHISYQ